MHSNDYIIIFFIIFFVLAIVVTKWTQGNKRTHNAQEDELTADERGTDEKDGNMTGNGRHIIYNKMGTKELLIGTLKRMGCPYQEAGSDRQAIWFEFQGEKFRAFVDETPIVVMQDLWWFSMPLDDIEGLSSLYKAINTANQYVWACVCYSTNEEEKTINVHSSLPIVLTEGIEDIDGYVMHMLKRFFLAQRVVRTEFDRLRASAK